MRAVFILFFTLILSGCSGAPETNINPGPDQIVRLADSEIKGLDPQKISDLSSLRVAADQFEGLTRHNASGEAEPGLAESWSVSPNGLTWTFILKTDLRFSDGTPFDAKLFPQVFIRLNDPATASPTRNLFANIISVKAPSSKQVIITLHAPDPALPDLLVHPALSAFPVDLARTQKDSWTTMRPMVTSGAYRLSTWQLNDHARLERNPEWHDGAPPVSVIIWKPMDDSLSAMRLFLSGGADTGADYPTSRHQWIKIHHADKMHSVPYLGSYYFAFNTRRPPFDDVRVRRALSMAVEREWIAEKVLEAGNVPAWGILPPGLVSKAAYKPEWATRPRERRLSEARALLSQAGYGPANPLKFEIRFNSSAEHRRVSVALAAMWQDLNVEASLFNSEAALHFAALRSHEFALARSGWIADLPTAENFLTVHQAANGDGNYSGYKNADYDIALAKAMTMPDLELRKKYMQEAEKILVRDMPVLPLYYYVTRSLVSPRIAGWKDNISNVHPSRTLRIRTP